MIIIYSFVCLYLAYLIVVENIYLFNCVMEFELNGFFYFPVLIFLDVRVLLYGLYGMPGGQ